MQEKRKSANVVLSQIQSEADEGTPNKEIPHFQIDNPVHGASFTIDANREGIFDPSPASKRARNSNKFQDKLQNL